MTWAQIAPALDDLIYRLGWTLLHSVWQGVLIAGVLLILLRLLSPARAGMRYAAALASLFAMVAASLVTAIGVHVPERPAPIAAFIDKPIVVHESTAPRALPLPELVANPVDAPFWNEQRILPWLVGGWSAGVLALSFWQLGGWMILQNHRRSAAQADSIWQQRMSHLANLMRITRTVSVAVTSRLDVPIVIGVIKPMILIPISMLSELSQAHVEAIIAHELAHVKRYDYLVNLIQCAIETVFFYHPAVWWMAKQIRREREYCCDELAASACGDRAGYARALAALEESRWSVRLAPAAMGRRGDLLMRVQRLLQVAPSPVRRERSRSGIIAVLLLVTCVGLPLMSHRSSAQSNPPTTAPAAMPADPRMAQPSPITAEDLVASAKDYPIGPNDMVQVSITGLVQPGVETQVARRVSESGMVSLPMIGQIKAAGLTDQELTGVIAAKYIANQLGVNEGGIAVQVLEARGRTFTINGDVGMVGQYAIVSSDLRVLDALALARSSPGGKTIRIYRKTDDPTQPRVLEIAGDRLAAGDMKLNVVIRPGDFLMVAQVPPAATPRAAADAEQKAMQAQVAAQQEAMDALKQRQESGEALTPTFVQLLLDTQERLAQAKLKAANDEFEKGLVLQQFLFDRLQFKDILQKRLGQDVTQVQMAQVNAAISSTRTTIADSRPTTRDGLRQQAMIYSQQVAQLTLALADAQGKYGTQHPAVLQLRERLAQMQKLYQEVVAQPEMMAPATAPAGAVESIRNPETASPDSVFTQRQIYDYAVEMSRAYVELENAKAIYGPSHAMVQQAEQRLQSLQRIYVDAQEQLRKLQEPKPAVALKSIDIVVQEGQILRDGKQTDWATIRKELEAIPAAERKRTFIALAAGSASLRVPEYFQAQAQAQKIVSELGLAYVSDTGMAPNLEEAVVGEYVIGGTVPRDGVYSLTGRKITLRAAIISAGGIDGLKDLKDLDEHPYYASIVRKGNRTQMVYINNIPLNELFSGKVPDITLQPDDQIMVSARPSPTTVPEAAH